MTHHSFAEEFATLLSAAIAFHQKNGVDKDEKSVARPLAQSRAKDRQAFWNHIATKPAMFFGDNSGWTLYCFLNGMQRGGDWLGLPPMHDLDAIFEGIKKRSQEAYGSPFAAFRVYTAQALLEWAGLPTAHKAS